MNTTQGEPIISFTTDFSTEDGYVGAVRGVMLSICPRARIVDISHYIPPQDVAHAAFVLHTASRYFPEGAVHLAIVDPDVGAKRRAICLLTEKWLFVGPDNGIFTPFLDEAIAAYSLENQAYWRDTISLTFHGRDIFGPVAAHLACGLGPSSLGPAIDNPARLKTWSNVRAAGRLEGSIVHIDHFGNCITSISPEDLRGFPDYTIWLPGNYTAPDPQALRSTYSDAMLGESCWLVGSAGLVELAVNGGNASKMFEIERGDPVWIEEKD